MISFLPGVAVPFFGFAFFDIPFSSCRFLFVMLKRGWDLRALLTDVAEASDGGALVWMVCSQRPLTQSLICEHRERQHRIMLLYVLHDSLGSDIGPLIYCRPSTLRLISAFHRTHTPPLYYAIRLRNADNPLAPLEVVLTKTVACGPHAGPWLARTAE